MTNFSLIRSSKGMTLSELMVSMGIITFFAASFFGVFYGMHHEMWREKVYYSIGMSAKSFMDHTARDIEEAIAAVDTHTFNGVAEVTGSNCLILKLPSIFATTDAINPGYPTNISSQFDYVLYKLDPLTHTVVRSLDVLDGVSAREGGVDSNDRVIAKKVNTIIFSTDYPSPGTSAELSTVPAASLSGFKYFHASILSQDAALGLDQCIQLESTMTLRN